MSVANESSVITRTIIYSFVSNISFVFVCSSSRFGYLLLSFCHNHRHFYFGLLVLSVSYSLLGTDAF